jgi:hypothetical protein
MNKQCITYEYQPHVITVIESNEASFVKQISNIEVAKETVQVIYEGNKTTVILADGTKAYTKCSPLDNFDSEIGLEIAFNRASIKRLTKKIKQLSKSNN